MQDAKAASAPLLLHVHVSCCVHSFHLSVVIETEMTNHAHDFALKWSLFRPGRLIVGPLPSLNLFIL